MEIRTSAQREQAFRDDFAKLLEKHNASFELRDNGRHFSHWIAEITMMTEWDDSGNIQAEYTEFEI